jgi:hypothetical protein
MIELATWVGPSGDTTIMGRGKPALSNTPPIVANSKYYNSNSCDCYGYYYADNRSVLLYVCVGCNDDRGWSLPFISGRAFIYFSKESLADHFLRDLC